MYNRRYDDRSRGRDAYPPSDGYGGRSGGSDFRGSYSSGSSGKRPSYSDRQSDMSYSSKRSRGLPPAGDSYLGVGGSRGSSAILDTPRYERNLLLAEEERLRQLEEIAQLKREHELTLLRRTLDMNRREVQAALSGRSDRVYGSFGGRDRQMDLDRRGIHDRDTRRDRLRRDAPRGPPRRDRSPPRQRSPIHNRLGSRQRSVTDERRSRNRSRPMSSRERSRTKTPRMAEEFKCDLCNKKFQNLDEKVDHEEKDAKHINVMQKLQAFSESSGTALDELIKKFIQSRSSDGKKDARNNAVSEEADKYPGLFYTGERWRVRVYNPDLILGSDFIVPATGWYCVLCQKFYYSESPAKTSHCRNKSHWENLRSWLKVNGHRYEPHQYHTFLKEEEKFKEELRRKRELETSAVRDRDSKERGTDGEGTQGAEEGEVIKEQSSSDAVKTEEVLGNDSNGDEASSTANKKERQRNCSGDKADPKSPAKDFGHSDDALDFEYDDDYIHESEVKQEEAPEVKGQEVVNESREENSGEQSSDVQVERGRKEVNGKDAEMYAMFDSLEAFLNGQNEEEDIQVSVVEDPFNSQAESEFVEDEGDEEDEDELNEPPTEEIGMDSGGIGEDKHQYNVEITEDVIPPSDEIEDAFEEDDSFAVHEEDGDEAMEEKGEKMEDDDDDALVSTTTVERSSSDPHQTPQLSIIEDELATQDQEEEQEAQIESTSPKRSPSKRAVNTARRGTRGGRGRGVRGR